MVSNDILEILDVGYAVVRYYPETDINKDAIEVIYANDKMKNILRNVPFQYENVILFNSSHITDKHRFQILKKAYETKEVIKLCRFDTLLDIYVDVNVFPISSKEELYGVLIKDINEEVRMQRQLQRSNHVNDIVMANSASIVFLYNFQEKLIINDKTMIRTHNLEHEQIAYPYGLIQKGLVKEEYLQELLSVVNQLEKGAQRASCIVEIKRTSKEQYAWYELIMEVLSKYGDIPIEAVGIVKDIDELKRQNQKLEIENLYDPLTLVYNRKGLQKEYLQFITANEQHIKQQHALLILDLDNFKQVNDQLGHDHGDLILQQFAHVLRINVRSNDLVARFGGDEFCVFLKNINEQVVRHTCERILQSKEMDYFHNLGISVSIGACYAKGTSSFADVYRHADQAMYQVKKQGKDGYTVTSLGS